MQNIWLALLNLESHILRKEQRVRVKLNTMNSNCSHKYISLPCLVTMNRPLPRIQRYGLCTPGAQGSREDKTGLLCKWYTLGVTEDYQINLEAKRRTQSVLEVVKDVTI